MPGTGGGLIDSEALTLRLQGGTGGDHCQCPGPVTHEEWVRDSAFGLGQEDGARGRDGMPFSLSPSAAEQAIADLINRKEVVVGHCGRLPRGMDSWLLRAGFPGRCGFCGRREQCR